MKHPDAYRVYLFLVFSAGFLANLFTVPLAPLAVSGLLIPALAFIRRANSLVDNNNWRRLPW